MPLFVPWWFFPPFLDSKKGGPAGGVLPARGKSQPERDNRRAAGSHTSTAQSAEKNQSTRRATGFPVTSSSALE